MKLHGFSKCSDCPIYNKLENGKCFSCNSKEEIKKQEERMKAEQAKREQENREREEQNKEQAEFERLKSLIEGSPDLTVLEKNYQKVKNSSFYEKNKTILDQNYTHKKESIKHFQEARDKFTTTITNSLNSHKLTNSDLSPEYRN